MLNFFAKFLLATTSLSPFFIAVAIRQFERDELWTVWIGWIVLAFCLVVLCWLLLKYAANNIQETSLVVAEFERKDQETLTFLFIYLLPFLRTEGSAISSDWLTNTYVLFIIVLAIVYAGAFHFNPVMRLVFGYRFYSVKDSCGVFNLLISRVELRRPGMEIRTVMIARGVHFYIGGEGA